MKRKTAQKWCEDDMEDMPMMKTKMDCMDEHMDGEMNDMEMEPCMEMKHGAHMGHGMEMGSCMEMKHGAHMGHGMEMDSCMEMKHGAHMGHGMDPGHGMHMHHGMHMGHGMDMGKEKILLAHAYVPWQFYHQAFSPQEALMKGTLFPELWGVYPIPE